MATLKQLLQDIDSAPDGPQIAAIFDFDGTIISGYSATTFMREQLRRGDLSPRQLAEIVSAMTSFGMGSLGFSAMMAVTTQFMRGVEEEAYREVGEQLYRKHIARNVYPESRALVEAHLKKGHTVAIISSATPYQVEAAARDLDIPHVMCTQLEVEDGRFTGRVISPTCFGQGKVDAAEQLAASTGANLDQSFFYSDSTDDLLLLERVGLPRALNPNSKLDAIARQRQWPIASFGSRGRASLSQWARSVAATVSLVPSFAAGLPIYALTGSRRDSVNFSFSLFADAASALVGLDLNVRGSEHLWSHRPAVFIFNHQSKADVIILARLLRRDIAGVGKKEIRKMPIIGKVMEMSGVVMIDRANAKSAIEAMKPLVTAMREESKSVVLAPEGTRSVSPKLLPFKKGAFHLAMQAGVPIVPIVIHNAGDMAPKGDFVFRPATVEVDVLPPVDTSQWSRRSIDEHVREVRNMFLATLGQPPEEVTPKRRATAQTATEPDVRPTTKIKATAKTKTKAKTRAKAKTSRAGGGRTKTATATRGMNSARPGSSASRKSTATGTRAGRTAVKPKLTSRTES
ncbi:MAG: HAD-IB family hydrolase [Parahaliea sp.]